MFIQNPDKNLKIAQRKKETDLSSMRSKRRARGGGGGGGSMSDESTLPLCTIGDILSRMPAKSITRFQSVSKPWSAVIQSPDFVSAHLRRSSSNPWLLIRRFHNPSGSNFAVILFNNKTNDVRDIKVPFFTSLSRYPKIVGSCNGLLCLDVSLCYACGFFLWNVSTCQFKALPRPRITDAQRPFWMVATGFGYNLQRHDYKLVRIVNFHRRPDEFPVVRAEVYSWRTGSWRVIDRRVTDHGIGSCLVTQGHQGVFVNGGLHWLGIGTGKLADHKFVVSFDMEAEEFRLIKIPDFVMGICIKILGYDDSLALAVYPAVAVYPGYGKPFERMELWVLQDTDHGDKSAWSKVNFINGLGSPEVLLNDSELVMKRLEGNSMNLSLFNIYNEGVRRLPSCESDFSSEFYSYVDSLVPVDSREVMEEAEAPQI